MASCTKSLAPAQEVARPEPCKGHGCDHCRTCYRGYCCGRDRHLPIDGAGTAPLVGSPLAPSRNTHLSLQVESPRSSSLADDFPLEACAFSHSLHWPNRELRVPVLVLLRVFRPYDVESLPLHLEERSLWLSWASWAFSRRQRLHPFGVLSQHSSPAPGGVLQLDSPSLASEPRIVLVFGELPLDSASQSHLALVFRLPSPTFIIVKR